MFGNQTCTALKGTIDVERAVNAALGAKGEKVAPLFAPENKDAFAAQRVMMAEMMGRGLGEIRAAIICVSSDVDVVEERRAGRFRHGASIDGG